MTEPAAFRRLATDDDGVYVISVASQMTGVPAGTLRLYEDNGLLTPARTAGGTRQYSPADIARIHRITELAAGGINLAGIKLVLQLQDDTTHLRAELDKTNAADQ
jgi:MerR family transcriptional regulator, heat shock protein HspR